MKTQVERRLQSRETALLLAVLCLAVAKLFSFPQLELVSLAVGLAGLVSTQPFSWIGELLQRIARRMNAFVAPVLFGLVYLLVLCPISLVYKRAGKGIARTRPLDKTYLRPDRHRYSKQDLDFPF